jgi:hypothetical protein
MVNEQRPMNNGQPNGRNREGLAEVAGEDGQINGQWTTANGQRPAERQKQKRGAEGGAREGTPDGGNCLDYSGGGAYDARSR